MIVVLIFGILFIVEFFVFKKYLFLEADPNKPNYDRLRRSARKSKVRWIFLGCLGLLCTTVGILGIIGIF